MEFHRGEASCRVLLSAPLDAGVIGWFSAGSPGDTVALLEDACAWCAARGATRVLGPMDGDTWHRYRLNLGPHDEPPFLLEPVNPPEWPGLWEAAGFRERARYCSKRIDDLAALAARVAPVHRRVLRRYRLRRFEPDRFEDELLLLHRLSLEIFVDNLFYTPIDEAAFLELYRPLQSLIDPDLVWFAFLEREPVGFVFMFPDGEFVNHKTIGVVKPQRRFGVAAALMYAAYEQALRKGLGRARHCLIVDGNRSDALDAGLGKVIRSYALYERTLSPATATPRTA